MDEKTWQYGHKQYKDLDTNSSTSINVIHMQACR